MSDDTAATKPPETREETESPARTKEAPPKTDRLPPFLVLLHNDDVNDMLEVVDALSDLTPLKRARAVEVMFTAHRRGRALVLITHRELAEHYRDRLRSRSLTVTIQPAQS